MLSTRRPVVALGVKTFFSTLIIYYKILFHFINADPQDKPTPYPAIIILLLLNIFFFVHASFNAIGIEAEIVLPTLP